MRARPALWRLAALDERGSTAIEFSLLGVVLVSLILGVIQFALVFVTGLQMRAAVSEAAGQAGDALLPQYRDGSQVRAKICSGLMMVDNCTSALKLEQTAAKSLSPSYTPIGNTYAAGSNSDIMVIRAAAPVVTFVPGVPQLYVRATAVWLSK